VDRNRAKDGRPARNFGPPSTSPKDGRSNNPDAHLMLTTPRRRPGRIQAEAARRRWPTPRRLVQGPTKVKRPLKSFPLFRPSNLSEWRDNKSGQLRRGTGLHSKEDPKLRVASRLQNLLHVRNAIVRRGHGFDPRPDLAALGNEVLVGIDRHERGGVPIVGQIGHGTLHCCAVLRLHSRCCARTSMPSRSSPC
jgi:hypothetical protein